MTDTFTHKGYTFALTLEPDNDKREPWNESDGHGIVSEWTRRAKEPSERVLHTDHRCSLYYDVAATTLIARRDGWGCTHGADAHRTAGERTACAVDQDYEFLRGWCADEWHYVGVLVSYENHTESLWGVEDIDPAYVLTVARELADEILTRVEVECPDVQLSEN